MHQFDKLEMFVYCAGQATEIHQELLQLEKDMLAAIDVPYRVIDTAGGDLGSSAARKFDTEAWVPTQNTYRELTSTSNCTTFQARRLQTRYRDADGKTQVAATLNGTLANRFGSSPSGEPPAGRWFRRRPRGASSVRG